MPKTIKKLKNTSGFKTQAKVQEKHKLSPQMNSFIKDKFYKDTPKSETVVTMEEMVKLFFHSSIDDVPKDKRQEHKENVNKNYKFLTDLYGDAFKKEYMSFTNEKRKIRKDKKKFKEFQAEYLRITSKLERASNLIQNQYKKQLNKKIDGEKPVVRTSDLNKSKVFKKTFQEGFNQANIDASKGKFDGFLAEDISSEIGSVDSAMYAFDKVTYPVKISIPKELQAEYGGVQEFVPAIYNGEKNAMRYYTKNKNLTQIQCAVLYQDDSYRNTFGYFINDKKMTDEMFKTYIRYVDDINTSFDDSNDTDIISTETIVYRNLSMSAPTNVDGSRKPRLLQSGVNSYMERNKLNNPIGIIDTHTTKEKLTVYDYINLNGLLEEINVNAQEAFDYICSYLRKNKEIKRIHTEDRETQRGASALKNLIDFFNAEKLRTTEAKIKDRKVKVYGYQELMNSPEYSKYCEVTGEVPITKYDTFKRWIKNRIDMINSIKKKTSKFPNTMG